MTTTKIGGISEIATAILSHGLVTYLGTNMGKVYRMLNSTGAMTLLDSLDAKIVSLSLNYPKLYITTNKGEVHYYTITESEDPAVWAPQGTSKGIDFSGMTPAFTDDDDHFISIGSYNSPLTIADTGKSFIPINVSLSSTGNVDTAGNQVAAARLRVNVATNHQANTAVSCLQLRMDLGKNCYAATGVSGSMNISANISLPTASLQGIYYQVTGAGAVTCPNEPNVMEIGYHQSSGGGGFNSVARFDVNATGCTITNIVRLENYAGTVTNGLLIHNGGTMTNAVQIGGTANVGILVAAISAIGISMPVGSVTQGIRIGNWAGSGAPGSAIAISAVTDAADTSQRNIVACYGESTTDLTSAIHANIGRFRHLVVGSGLQVNHETYGLVGQLVGKSATLLHMHAGLMGTLESNTTALVCNGAYPYSVAAVIARIGGGALITATKPIAGFSAIFNGAAISAAGVGIAYAACATADGNWTYLLGADNCDNLLYVATGSAYECGVKVATQLTSNAYPKMDGIIRMYVGGTPYYIPLYAAGNIDNE